MRRARALHETVRVLPGPCGVEQIARFEAHLKVQNMVFDSANLNRVSTFFFLFMSILICFFPFTAYVQGSSPAQTYQSVSAQRSLARDNHIKGVHQQKLLLRDL